MKLIMFDYDGVLVDSFMCNVNIYQDISKAFNLNLPKDPEYYRELFELDWRLTMKKLNIITKEDLDRQEIIYKNGLKTHYEEIRIYKDIPKILNKLSKKYKLAVVTNNFRTEIEYRLKKHNLRNYFDAILSCEDGELKPSPDLVKKCINRFKVNPDESILIGDMDGDIESGKKAGVNVIAVTYGFHNMHRLKDADFIVNSPSEILEAINNLN